MDWSVEFERLHKVDGIAEQPVVVQIQAEPAECEAVARRLELQAVADLRADCTLDRPAHGEGVRLRGRLSAHVVQTCVVTLEPLPMAITAEFERHYLPGWTPEIDGDEETVDAEAPDIEPLDSDSIDLGEAVVEELSLALDPYPRLAGAVADDDGDDEPPGPFQSLAALRRS